MIEEIDNEEPLDFAAIRAWYMTILSRPDSYGTFKKRIEISGNFYDAEVEVNENGATKIKVTSV